MKTFDGAQIDFVTKMKSAVLWRGLKCNIYVILVVTSSRSELISCDRAGSFKLLQ